MGTAAGITITTLAEIVIISKVVTVRTAVGPNAP